MTEPPAPYYTDPSVTLYHGDCLDVLRTIPAASVHAVVTDPPYGLGFMGREWDDLPPGDEWARECLRVLRPGGYLLAFGGARTWHRLAVAVEDAGFEVRDSIAWLYGSGFPKSLDVSKAIDKAAGATREAGAPNPWSGRRSVPLPGAGGTVAVEGGAYGATPDVLTAPATPAAQQWAGWGTALKPAFEPIVVARKPLVGTVAGNVLAYGTGALNVDGCRVAHADAADLAASQAKNPGRGDLVTSGTYGGGRPQQSVNAAGRWPTNVVLDGDAAAELDGDNAVTTSQGGSRGAGGQRGAYSPIGAQPDVTPGYGDTGGPSRFFPVFRYEPKAPTAERPRHGDAAHPTVKPLGLMRWLVRLVTPPGGTVLDPFAGSGTTGEACIVEGVSAVLIEREAAYLPLIVARLSKPIQPDLFGIVHDDAPAIEWPT